MRHGASPLRTPQGKSPLRVLMLALMISLQVIAGPRGHSSSARRTLPHYGSSARSTHGLSASAPTHHRTSRCTSCARNLAGRIERSGTSRARFEHEHPCPSSGKRSGPCAGHVIDHVKPLACGGADQPSNMQWQTSSAAKAKDKVERKGCK
jgi:hypothetical protein